MGSGAGKLKKKLATEAEARRTAELRVQELELVRPIHRLETPSCRGPIPMHGARAQSPAPIASL